MDDMTDTLAKERTEIIPQG